MSSLIDYYNSSDENGRLYKDNGHQIEWLTTIKYLEKYIPAGAKIFDCCAGTGRYSFWLAERGFEVTAGDLIEKHVELMRTSSTTDLLKDIVVCDVLNMPDIDDNTFDVVMCMGAYYHIHEKEMRKKAVIECRRILKDNGLLVLAYINRNAIFLMNFKNNPIDAVEADTVMCDGKNGFFYASDFGEVEKLCADLKLKKIADVSTDGLTYPLRNEINSLNPLQFEKYLKYHYMTCEEQSIKGNSMHGLYIAQKIDE
jgi:SAM-dependent methyltransferase